MGKKNTPHPPRVERPGGGVGGSLDIRFWPKRCPPTKEVGCRWEMVVLVEGGSKNPE